MKGNSKKTKPEDAYKLILGNMSVQSMSRLVYYMPPG